MKAIFRKRHEKKMNEKRYPTNIRIGQSTCGFVDLWCVYFPISVVCYNYDQKKFGNQTVEWH